MSAGGEASFLKLCSAHWFLVAVRSRNKEVGRVQCEKGRVQGEFDFWCLSLICPHLHFKIFKIFCAECKRLTFEQDELLLLLAIVDLLQAVAMPNE